MRKKVWVDFLGWTRSCQDSTLFRTPYVVHTALNFLSCEVRNIATALRVMIPSKMLGAKSQVTAGVSLSGGIPVFAALTLGAINSHRPHLHFFGIWNLFSGPRVKLSRSRAYSAAEAGAVPCAEIVA